MFWGRGVALATAKRTERKWRLSLEKCAKILKLWRSFRLKDYDFLGFRGRDENLTIQDKTRTPFIVENAIFPVWIPISKAVF